MNRLFVLVLVVLASCGGASATPATTVALPTATGGMASADARRGPSNALAMAWPFESAETVGYVDIAGLERTKLFATLIPVVLASMSPFMSDAQAKCIRDLATSAKEAAFGAHGSEMVTVVRFDGDVPTLAGCATGAQPITIAGAKEAYRFDRDIVATKDDILAYGANPAVVERALHPAGPAASLRAIRLEEGTYVDLRSKDANAIHVTLSVSDEHFLVRAGLDFHDRERAASVVKEVQSSPDQISAMASELAKPDELERFKRLLARLMVSSHDTHVDASFELREPPAEQARDLGLAVAIATQGVRKYIIASKQVEAHATLNAIARDIVEQFESETLPPVPFARKKLKSYPAVPKTVPRGVKYVSTPDDWKPWAALKFTMEEPQYFQYEVRASKDGESAEVIAHGDLNGDGKTSTFSLPLHIDRQTKHIVVAPGAVTTDPDE